MVSPTGAPSISLMPAMRKPTSPVPRRLALRLLGREHADAVRRVAAPGGHHLHLVAALDDAVDHPDQGHDADVGVEPGIDDQGLQRRVRIAHRRRDARHQGLEQVRDALPRLGADPQGILRLEADDLLDLVDHPLRLRRRQIDLVEHRQDLQPLLDGRVAVGHALGLDALGGIHHQQRALAGGQRAGDLVGEVHVAGGVDEVQLVGLARRAPCSPG